MSSTPHMKAAYLVGGLPVVTEHAVLEEIAGAAAEGVMARVLALFATGQPCPPEFTKLLEEAIFLRPDRGLGRWLGHTKVWKRRRLRQLLARERPDLLHAEFGHLGLLAWPVTSQMGIPLVVSFRGQDILLLKRRSSRIRNCFFGNLARVLARSEDMRRDLLLMGCPPEKLFVHPSGIRAADIPFRERSSPGSGEDIVILMVGRMTPKKGMSDGLRAVAQCRPGGRGVQVRIIGDGPQRNELKKMARALGLSEKVAFLGAMPRARVIKEMLAAHVFMLPCRTAPDGEKEGIPNAIKEAMATGLPVLSTRHAGIPECVEHGTSGLLAVEGDVAELARNLEEILSHPERWAAMGRRGREIVQARYDAAMLAGNLLRHYHEILERRPEQ